MVPVIAGMVPYTCLLDGSISMVDIARMVDALTVKGINNERWRKAMENRGK